MYPKLKFQLNIQLDMGVASEFLDLRGGGIDFGKGILSLYPELEKAENVSPKIKNNVITTFTKHYYNNHKLELETKLNSIEKEWKKVEKGFFANVEDIFNNHPWPNGDYICFLSIYDCNPRFLNNKTFQVYYKHRAGAKSVIIHEMLHFIFYDYLEHKEKKYYSSLNEQQLWLLSEAFDEIILNTPQFKNICKGQLGSYPAIKSLVNNIKVELKNRKVDIISFLKSAKKNNNSFSPINLIYQEAYGATSFHLLADSPRLGGYKRI